MTARFAFVLVLCANSLAGHAPRPTARPDATDIPYERDLAQLDSDRAGHLWFVVRGDGGLLGSESVDGRGSQ